jgi:hypothetical protein
MLGVGVFVVWVGYSLAFYGIDQIRGGNNGLLSLMIPGKYTNQRTDAGSSQSAVAEADSAAAVKLQKVTAAQTAAGKAARPGGPKGNTGSGSVAVPGGITALISTTGTVTCINKKGKIVPCPAGITP